MKTLTVALAVIALAMAGCTQQPASQAQPRPQPQPQQAGKPLEALTLAARIAAMDAAAISGDQQAIQQNLAAFQEDYRQSLKLADPARRIDRESARSAARRIDGVRSVAWLDHDNLLAIVARNDQRSYQTIDAICLELEPLGDTLGVVVNLQSGAAVTGDELEVLSRNCQLAPGERGLLQADRQIDVIAPEVRAQHRAAQEPLQRAARDRKAESAASLRILEASTDEM